MNHFVILLALGLVVSGCNSSQKYNITEEYNKVLAIHDEVMPKMGYISSLQRTLRAFLDTSTLQSDTIQIRSTIIFLANAEEGMWEWMNQIKKPDQNDVPTAKTYLENEMQKIIKVKEDMLQSIEQGETLIEKYHLK